ncbi:MAG: hypothetical protein HYV96_11515 [Opitutae bacterium]|nr:hypothetical protein [Opitutae bacterium]
MNAPRPLEIVGGGLAGLSLGGALARAGVSVTVHETHAFPRHRVCGEFIRGLDERTIAHLGLAPVLAGALPVREVRWFARDTLLRRHRLTTPALALSRHMLDARLAGEFLRAGGTLHANRRASSEPAVGRVLATGRAAARDPAWIGLKLHAFDLPTAPALEMHLGDRAYVGVCPLPDGRTNVCGLFRRRAEIAAARAELLPAYLRAAGLDVLAARLARAEIDPESCTAVAGLPFRPRLASDGVRLGDAFAMIPPFTGNGMALAFQSAALAVAPLLAWARHEITWAAAERGIARRLRRRFGLRLRVASLCHAPLTSPRPQRWLAAATSSGLVPFGWLQRVLS